MPDHPAEPIHARLRRLREAAGLTVAELAPLADLAPKTLYRYEAGERMPSWGALRGLASALGADLGDFAGCLPEPEERLK